MMCNWKELLSILPMRFRQLVDDLGKERMQELRFRVHSPPELVLDGKSIFLKYEANRDDLDYIINAASKYSPWHSTTVSRGYLTAPGGHRIGLSGEVVIKNGEVSGIRILESVCIRVARDYPGISNYLNTTDHSILILGAPGWGKTTLLRDFIRRISENDTVSVVDERGELFPAGFQRGKRMDVLTGCPKSIGIEQMLRTMGPEWIAVDEITSQVDCHALIHASNCGVKLMATAHAGSMKDFRCRSVYKLLIQNKVFQSILILNQDKEYTLERMDA